MPHIPTEYDFLRKSARVSKSLGVRARIRRGRGSSAHNPNDLLYQPLGAGSFEFFVRLSASAPFAARFSNGEAFLLSTVSWGVSCGQYPALNFFSKKVHKKLAKRYTRFARVRTPTRGVDFWKFSGEVY